MYFEKLILHFHRWTVYMYINLGGLFCCPNKPTVVGPLPSLCTLLSLPGSSPAQFCVASRSVPSPGSCHLNSHLSFPVISFFSTHFCWSQPITLSESICPCPKPHCPFHAVLSLKIPFCFPLASEQSICVLASWLLMQTVSVTGEQLYHVL